MITYRTLIKWGTVALLLFTGIHGAQAADPCTSNAGDGNFGTVTSFNVATLEQKVTANSGFACAGGLLTLLTSTKITATITSTAHPNGTSAQMVNGANNQAIPYIICQDTACAQPLNIGTSKSWTITSLLGLLGLFNSSNGTVPFYLQTAPTQNLRAGVYTDTINIQWQYTYCSIGVVVCLLTVDGVSNTPILVTMTVSNFCFIDNAPNVTFGTAAFPAAFTPVTGNSLSVRCTLGATYSVNLTSNNPLNGQYRQMASTANGVTNYLQYQILKADTTVWTPTADLSATGTGVSQFLNYTATVNPNQPNVLAGTYTDTVVVTVTY